MSEMIELKNEKVASISLSVFDLSLIVDALNIVNVPGKIADKYITTKIKIISALKELEPTMFDPNGELKQK